MWNLFEHSNQLEITNRERERSLASLFLFLRENPNSFGNVLLGLEEGPWTKQDVKRFETLILKRVSDEKQIADFLSIARSSAHLWSVSERKVIHLPRHFVPPKRYDSPFSNDYAPAVARYRSWRDTLSSWIYVLFPDNSAVIEDRSLLLTAFITSAILHGGALGTHFLVALVRAIRQKRERTFAINDRIHIELALPWQGVAEAEQRIWVPDPLTATLWKMIRMIFGLDPATE